MNLMEVDSWTSSLLMIMESKKLEAAGKSILKVEKICVKGEGERGTRKHERWYHVIKIWSSCIDSE